MKIRRRIVFYGYVQGVGFRWRARFAADEHNCTGWIRNDWEGTVTMEIQGEEIDIDRVIIEIESGRYIRISNMEATNIPLEEDERRFRVR